MAAEIKFYAGPSWTLLSGGSGLGFYGAAFGNSVQVGQYQDSTYITNSGGSAEGPAATNAKYIDVSGVTINGGAEVHPSSLVLTSGTINVRFTYDEDNVQTQNGELRIFDRSDPDTGAVGVTTQVCQLVNGGSGVNSSGDASGLNAGFVAPSGSGTIVTLLRSPGSGGLSPSGYLTEDVRHDWYFLMSAKPDSIGSKTAFGMYVSLEYF